MKSESRTIPILAVFTAIILVLIVQLIAIGRPIAGHFASYQCVMAHMARNFSIEGVSGLLLPKLNLLLIDQKSLHLNQYPFPSVFAGYFHAIFGGAIEVWGRLQSVVWNILSFFLIVRIAGQWTDKKTSWIAGLFFLLSPFTIIYGQAFMSEPFALFCLLAAIALYLRANQDSLSLFTLLCAGVLFSMAIAGRVHFILIAPIFIMDMLFFHKKAQWLKCLVFMMASASVAVLWYGFTYVVGLETPAVMTNIFIQVAARTVGDQNYLGSPEYYKRVFDIFAQGMFTPLTFPFLVIGFFVLKSLPSRFRAFLLGSVGLTGILIILSPQKVMDHDFYLYALFPFLCVIAGMGFSRVKDKLPYVTYQAMQFGMIVLVFVVGARYFFNPIYKAPEREVKPREIAQRIDSLIPSHERVIVFGEGPSIMGYYVNRECWFMDPGGLGKELAYYFKDQKFRKSNSEEMARLEHAMKNYVTWLEYLRGHGARYLLAFDRRELSDYPIFSKYLRDAYKLVSAPNDSYSLYRLEV